MKDSTSVQAAQLAVLIADFINNNPEIGGLTGLAGRTGISYDSLRKYAKAATYPPPEKLRILLAFINGQPLQRERQGLFTQDKEGEGVSSPLERDSQSSSERQTQIVASSPDATLLEMITEPTRTGASEEDYQELYIPVHGFVWFRLAEMEIIDHPAFQRLSGLHQLGLAHFIYRGATHRRLEHALGTVHTAQKIIYAIEKNAAHRGTEKPNGDYRLGRPLNNSECRFVRLAALLHDIGHVPFGHAFEDELGLLDKHDGRARLDKVFARTRWDGITCESLADAVDRLYSSDMPSYLNISASELVKRIILHESIDAEVVSGSIQSQNDEGIFRISICSDIVGNTICADFLDYLYRDWYHIGKPQYFDDRIFHYMEIRTPITTPMLSDGVPKQTSEDAFVVSIGSRPKLRTDGVSTIMGLLDKRYELSEAVIFHRTKMVASAMLERALSLTIRNPVTDSRTANSRHGANGTAAELLEDWLLDNPEEALLLDIIRDRTPFSGIPHETHASSAGKLLATKLVHRNLYNHLLAYTYDDEIGLPAVERIQHVYSSPENRDEALSLLEKDFGLDPGMVVMYCPDGRMNKKIAQVRLFVEGYVEQFETYENEHNYALSAGRLHAQLERHKRLWQIGFYVDTSVIAKGEDFLYALREAIRYFVLGLMPRGEKPEVMSRQVAASLTRIASSHKFNHVALTEAALVAARGDDTILPRKYPMGAPSILAYIGDARS